LPPKIGDSFVSKKSSSGSASSNIGKEGFGRSWRLGRVHIFIRIQDPRRRRAEPTPSRMMRAKLIE
jgi:hypothetical protein